MAVRDIRMRTYILQQAFGLFSEHAVQQTSASGVALYLQEGTSQGIYCLFDGHVKMTHVTEAGTESIIALQSAGSVLGIASALDGTTHVATATTVSKCNYGFLALDIVRCRITEDPAFSRSIHLLLAAELCGRDLQIAWLTSYSVRWRLENFFWERLQIDAVPDGILLKLRLPIKLSEVAQLLAITPVYLSRLLSQMERDGVLQRRNGWLVFTTPLKLQHSTRLPQKINNVVANCTMRGRHSSACLCSH